MSAKKYPTLTASLLLSCFLFFTCSEDDPKQFGNDGSLLTRINIVNSVAFVSSITSSLTTVDDISYENQELFTVTKEGILDKTEFEITGTGGGFDKYVVHDINDMYFLISFILRKESYFIEKKTGNAVKSAYVNSRWLSFNNTYSTRFPYSFYGLHNNDFYFKDANNQWFHVNNVLTGNAKVEAITFDKEPEQLFFDQKGGVYIKNQYSLYYFSNGVSKEVVTDFVGIFIDRDRNLKVVEENGNISILLDGAKSENIKVPGLVYAWNPFTVFHFEDLESSLAIYTPKTLGSMMLYDIDKKEKKMDLINKNGNSLEIIDVDSFRNLIMIVYYSDPNGKMTLRIIDVTTFKFSEVDITGLESNNIESFYAVSENLMLTGVCRKEAGGACYRDTEMLKSSGTAVTIASNPMSIKVITVN